MSIEYGTNLSSAASLDSVEEAVKKVKEAKIIKKEKNVLTVHFPSDRPLVWNEDVFIELTDNSFYVAFHNNSVQEQNSFISTLEGSLEIELEEL